MSFIIQFTSQFGLVESMNAWLWAMGTNVTALVFRCGGGSICWRGTERAVRIHQRAQISHTLRRQLLTSRTVNAINIDVVACDLARWTAARGLMGADQRSSDRLVSHARGSARLVALHAMPHGRGAAWPHQPCSAPVTFPSPMRLLQLAGFVCLVHPAVQGLHCRPISAHLLS